MLDNEQTAMRLAVNVWKATALKENARFEYLYLDSNIANAMHKTFIHNIQTALADYVNFLETLSDDLFIANDASKCCEELGDTLKNVIAYTITSDINKLIAKHRLDETDKN